jgi:replicative DNA helicase
MNKKTYKKDKPAFDFQFGKVPPNSKSLEASILGAIMLEKGAFDIAIEIIKSECFYVDAHKIIFQAMCLLQQKNSPIDTETIFEELRKSEDIDKVGGPFALIQLTKSVFSAANIEAHCKIIYQKYLQREVIRISSEAIGNAYEDSCDAFDLVDQTEKEISGINNITSKSYSNIQDEVVSVLNNIYTLKNSGKELIGVNTGFKAMNQLTCGWQSPDFIVLAARPSVGKTALALRLARNANCPVGFFSLEMNKRQLIQRILSAESGIHLENIIRGRLSEDELDMLSVVAGDLKNFMIDDKAAPNIYELRNKARKMKKDGAGLIIIDYLQLMKGIDNGRPDNREQEISKISRDIKSLCKELEIPIIALSQLSRGVESRQNKMPQLSDLRESGAIEQDADIVMAMYRPEYYGVNVNENGDNMNGETHIKFLKHRNGALDTIKLRAKLSIQQFYDFEDQPKQLGLTNNFRPVTQSEKISSDEDPF